MNSALLLLSICFLGVLSVGDRNRSIKITHTASKIIGLPASYQPDLITKAFNLKAPKAQIIHSISFTSHVSTWAQNTSLVL